METPIKTYIANFRTAVQISPDDWDTCTKSLLVTEETTVGEIVAWFHTIEKGGDVRIVLSQSDAVPHLNGKG